MSMLPYLFDSDWFQRRDIESLRSDLRNAESQLQWSSISESQQSSTIERLTSRVNELNLVVSGLVRTLVQAGIVKPNELAELLRQIDLEDGQQDGQLSERTANTPQWCPKCEAKIAADKSYCMFCGEQFETNDHGERWLGDGQSQADPLAAQPMICSSCGAKADPTRDNCVFCEAPYW